MAMINMRIWDVTGSRCQQVEAPDDVALARVLVLLVERMNLPINSPDGQIMSYKLHHKRTRRQLLDGQSLSEAGVINGDDLRLQPEITAGKGSAGRGDGWHPGAPGLASRVAAGVGGTQLDKQAVPHVVSGLLSYGRSQQGQR